MNKLTNHWSNIFIIKSQTNQLEKQKARENKSNSNRNLISPINYLSDYENQNDQKSCFQICREELQFLHDDQKMNIEKKKPNKKTIIKILNYSTNVPKNEQKQDNDDCKKENVSFANNQNCNNSIIKNPVKFYKQATSTSYIQKQQKLPFCPQSPNNQVTLQLNSNFKLAKAFVKKSKPQIFYSRNTTNDIFNVKEVKSSRNNKRTVNLLPKCTKQEEMPIENHYSLMQPAIRSATLNFSFSYNVISQTGYMPYSNKVNQDAFSVRNYTINGDEAIDMYIVCDGHGKFGNKISWFVANSIPDMIRNHLYKYLDNSSKKVAITLDLIEAGIKQSCLMCQNILKKNHEQSFFSGTTMALSVIWQDNLIMANVGDCKAFLATKKGNNIVSKLSTEEHRPDSPKEKSRIIAAGGKVAPQVDEDGCHFGDARIWNKEMTAPGMAMSRTIGDIYAQKLGVVNSPEIVRCKISSNDKFIVMGSDGIFSFLSNQYCIGKVANFYNKSDSKGAVKKLIDDSTYMWKNEEDSIDDITCLLIFISKA